MIRFKQLGVLVVGAGVLCGGVGGCDERRPAGAAAAATERYVTRGRVEGVSSHPGASPMIQVHHEAVPQFKDRTGAVVGMKEMVMDFPAGEGVKIGEFKAGDVVEVEFVVDWSKTPYHAATRVTKLAAETVLRIGKFEDGGR